MHSDNSGEYCRSFDEYCKHQGIRHQKTPLKTSQLNGLAERMNMTLIERVRYLVSKAKLQNSFWGEALLTDACSKLDAKTRQCILIGYGLDKFGYMLYDPIEKKLLRSRDILFMESETIENISKVEKLESSNFDAIGHLDEVSNTSVHDGVGLDNHGDA
ncbi:hypothetical protein KY290_005181 [Solanum tuberosum]|uniref:Integrase catalytic domain-containing protein n=1 Tax=Solanum tuberosum TaxID=4113 RepID=A0ABQ7WF70_SOLTU|nr:hypothetical protein KY290_005181 [Solanum tuberosum]